MLNSRTCWLLGGLLIGLSVGFNLGGLWRPMPLHAVATHGQDSLAICTAPMDDDVEAIFTIDSVTGDLKGGVMNVQTRNFTTLFERNVVQDLPTPTSKNPQYRIVSGVAHLRQVVAAGQLGRSVVYVAEVTSGQLVAYGVPWIPGRAASPIPFKGELVPLDRWQYRTTAIRN